MSPDKRNPNRKRKMHNRYQVLEPNVCNKGARQIGTNCRKQNHGVKKRMVYSTSEILKPKTSVKVFRSPGSRSLQISHTRKKK
jgi:hypothetical protein